MKPSIPKGTRDFLPAEVIRRKYMFDTIENVFRKFGYLPIETPAMESLQTLSGKYGEEGDRLLFKILNNGDYLSKADKDALAAMDSSKLVSSISKRGLRYDLTVPFARFVVMHRNELQLPFKRYQIQPVWRADRPQKGRYQEFYQCDVDVVGSKSLVYEAELVQIYDEVFSKLGLNVNIRLNHRKILAGIAEICQVEESAHMTVAIDKWDKIGPEGVRKDMVARGISEESANQVIAILQSDSFDSVAQALQNSEAGREGVEQLREVQKFLGQTNLSNTLVLDPRLARGLDYYTGCIFEVESPDYTAGSIGGGGRYDDLTGIFGMPNIPGVGVSFGAARIYDALDQLDLFPPELEAAPRLLLLPLDKEGLGHTFGLLTKVRSAGISADMYPEASKVQKQMKYANAIGVRYVVIIGENEISEGKYQLKDMRSGNKATVDIDALIEELSA